MDKVFIENDLYKREEKSKKLPVLFYTQVLFDEAESLQKGKLIFKNVPYIQIETGNETGSDLKIFPVNEEFKKRYPEQWDNFKKFIAPLIKTNSNEIVDIKFIFEEFPEVFNEYKKNIKNIIDGETLIEEIGIYPLSKAIELKYYGYFFVEQILNLTEENEIITKEMIEIAKNWKERNEENEVLKKQVLDLTSLVKDLSNELKRLKNV